MSRHILAVGHVPSPIVEVAKLPCLVVTLDQILGNNGRVPPEIVERIEGLKRVGYAVVRTDDIKRKRAEFRFETTGQGVGWQLSQQEIDDWFADAMRQSAGRGPSPLQPYLSASTVANTVQSNWILHASTVAMSMMSSPINRTPDPPVILKQPDPIPIGGRKILIDTSH